MCFAFKSPLEKIAKTEVIRWESLRTYLNKMQADGSAEYQYPKSKAVTILKRNQDVVLEEMHWDLIPSFYLKGKDYSVSEILKYKASKKLNPETGKSFGFSSYNARIETVDKLPSFKLPWKNSQRCVVPVVSYLERPNMDEAPVEYKGREYAIDLDSVFYLGSLYDVWSNTKGESLLSFTVITLSSESNPLIQSIWHERMPVLIPENKIEEWLDPTLSPEKAKQLCQPLNEKHMSLIRRK